VLNLAIAALIALIVILKLFVVTHPVLVGSYMEQQYPVRAVDWLAANGQNGRLLNEYNWGGYIQWVLRDTPVFVDGRTDLFGDQVIGDWMALVSAGENWQDLLVKYQIDLMLVEAGRPLVEKLDEAGWQLLYMDEQAVIYARNGR
jgi:hypothetical protein